MILHIFRVEMKHIIDTIFKFDGVELKLKQFLLVLVLHYSSPNLEGVNLM